MEALLLTFDVILLGVVLCWSYSHDRSGRRSRGLITRIFDFPERSSEQPRSAEHATPLTPSDSRPR